jgi:hypothetical protein
VRALYGRARRYQDRLDDLGLSDRDVQRDLRPGELAARVLRNLALALVWLPLAALGAPVHFPLIFLIRLAGPRFAPRKDVVGTTKFLAGFLSVLTAHATLAALAGWLWGWPWALAAALALPASLYATLRVLDRWGRFRSTLAATAKLLRFRREVEGLRAERAALEAEVVAAVDRLRPPDLVPLFPRAG